jgi:hypothetical protein
MFTNSAKVAGRGKIFCIDAVIACYSFGLIGQAGAIVSAVSMVSANARAKSARTIASTSRLDCISKRLVI